MSRPDPPPRRFTPRGSRRFWDGPRRVGDGVERVMHHLAAPKASVVEGVFSDWPALVGEVIGAHTRPVRITDGVLLVEVDDPAWASEMTWMGEELVRQIRAKLDTDEVDSITVRIARET